MAHLSSDSKPANASVMMDSEKWETENVDALSTPPEIENYFVGKSALSQQCSLTDL